MAPVYDYSCSKGHTHEAVEGYEVSERKCPKCGKTAHRIISMTGQHCGNQDADWLKTVHKVIDKRPGKQGPATREFLKNPTRANHKAWMKERGITFLEPGEENDRPRISENDVPSTRALAEEYTKRNRIEVRTR